MAINPNNLLGQSNPNGTVGVSLGIDPAGANEAFSAGVTSGFVVRPNSPAGMTVKVGSESGVVDSALVRSPAGITFPVGNVSGTAIELAVPAAPSTNSRIDSVVLYVDTSVEVTETDGADALGMEIVSGTSASTPVPPTDQQIRAAIEDGASIAYVVIANITVANGATTITQSDIENTNRSTIGAEKVDFATIVGGIRSGLSDSQTLSSTTGQNTVNLSTTRYQWGVGFSQGANAIRITAGIDAIIASGQIYYFTNTANSKITQTIRLNGDDIALINRHTGTSNYQTYSFGTIMIPVSEGDVVSMTARNETTANCVIGANATNTWLQLIGVKLNQ